MIRSIAQEKAEFIITDELCGCGGTIKMLHFRGEANAEDNGWDLAEYCFCKSCGVIYQNPKLIEEWKANLIELGNIRYDDQATNRKLPNYFKKRPQLHQAMKKIMDDEE